MATTNKMTKATAFALAIKALEATDFPERGEAIAKLAKEIENVSKKSSGSGKPTKVQQENAQIAQDVAEFMAGQPNRLFTISELSKECPAILGATPQKIRPLLTALIKANQVERTEGKGGKPLFQFVGEVED